MRGQFGRCAPPGRTISARAGRGVRSRLFSRNISAAAVSARVWLPCANLSIRRPLPHQDEAFLPHPCKILLVPDIKQFSDKVGALPSEKVYVSLSSDGGDAVAAAIGDLIRLSGMKTVVPENKRCISACAFIWLGSPDRYLGSENSVVGFHGAYNPNTGQPGHFNLKIAVYLGYLGFSYDAVEWILGAPPLAIRWLTPETSKQYSIYYSELAPRRSVPFVDDQLANLPLPPKPPVEPAISAPVHPTPHRSIRTNRHPI